MPCIILNRNMRRWPPRMRERSVWLVKKCGVAQHLFAFGELTSPSKIVCPWLLLHGLLAWLVLQHLHHDGESLAQFCHVALYVCELRTQLLQDIATCSSIGGISMASSARAHASWRTPTAARLAHTAAGDQGANPFIAEQARLLEAQKF